MPRRRKKKGRHAQFAAARIGAYRAGLGSIAISPDGKTALSAGKSQGSGTLARGLRSLGSAGAHGRSHPIAIFIIFILVCYVGMVYGPVGAFLAEYFPGRIRYASVSVPYHIGNGWGGGLVPFITSAAFAATGSVGYALIYPIAVPAVCFVLALFLMPETRKISIWEPEKGTAAA